jgi:putative intracellular protease/amidase
MKPLYKIFFTLLIILTFPCFSESAENKKKALIVVTSHDKLGTSGKQTGFWLCEATHAYLVLESKGFEIDFVSPLGGKAPVDERSLEPENAVNKTFNEKKDAVSKLENTLKPKDIKPEDYSVVIFVGGHGALWDFVDNKYFEKIAAKVYENGGIVAASEHGQAALLDVKLSNGRKLIEGRSVAAFNNEQEAEMKLTEFLPFSLEDEIIKRGAKFTEAPNWKPRVAVSERLITGQNTASMKYLLDEIVKLLK